MSHLAGSSIGKRYQIEKKLGEGAMGSVYVAVDRLNRQTVALKRVLTRGSPVPSSGDSTLAATQVALANEFQTLASLHHPHIIQVLDYGFDDQRQPYFTMTLLEGARPVTEAGQGTPQRVKLRLLLEILQALAYLHQHGIVHRDLKPDNALVTVDNEVKLLDFGLAALREKLDIGDGLSGTLAYMAPEIFMGEPASITTDLYAVGVIAYELFAGHHPFNVMNAGELINEALYKPADLTALDVGYEIKDIIEQLLTKDPKNRYHNAYDVIEAFTVISTGRIQRESAAIRESFLQAARFVGREKETAQLTEALQKSLNRQGSVWLIGGESGVGKSRLLNELRVRALVRGMLVLNGQGVEGGGLSYQLWREPLRRLSLATEMSDAEIAVLGEIVTDIDQLVERSVPPISELDGQAGQQRLVTTIVNIFRRQEEPILLILEDLHWATESLDVLKPLIALVESLPLMIVGSYRHDERPSLPDEIRGTQMIRLERLSDNGIAELSASMLGDAGRQPEVVELLRKETEGNVFFLVEVVRALAEEAGGLGDIGRTTLPKHVFAGGVQQVIQNRLKRMPAEARPLLDLAAIVGRQIDLDLLQALEPKANLDEWLTACSNAAVLDVMDENWRFAHDKLRHLILDVITDNERKAIHQRVAAAMQEVYAANEDEYAAQIADHYAETDDLGMALQWAVRAGKHCQATYAPIVGIGYYQRALRLWREQPEIQSQSSVSVIELYERLGEMLNWQARYKEAIEAFQAMRAIAEERNDEYAQADAWYGIARTQTYQGDLQTALSSASQAEVLARRNDARLTLARALWMKGWVLFRLGNLSEAKSLAEQVLELCNALEVEDLKGNTLNLLGAINIVSGQYDQAAGVFEEAQAIFQKLGDKPHAMTIINNLGWLAETRGDYQLANQRYSEALRFARETGHRDAEMVYLSNLGGTRVMLEDYSRAETDLRQVIEMASTSGLGVLSETYRALAEACLYQGNKRDALGAAQQALVLGREVSSQDYIAAAWRVLGLVSIFQEERVRAIISEDATYDGEGCFAESLRICDEGNLEGEKARTLRAWARYKLAQGDRSEAERLWQEAHDIFERLGAILEAERMSQLPKA